MNNDFVCVECKSLKKNDNGYFDGYDKKYCIDCSIKLCNEKKINKEYMFKCGICNKICFFRDHVHYDTNECCCHCNIPLCSEHIKVVLHHNAYILEVHCPKCSSKCDICGFVGCVTEDFCVPSCSTIQYLPTINKCFVCHKNVCSNCYKNNDEQNEDKKDEIENKSKNECDHDIVINIKKQNLPVFLYVDKS